MTEARAGNKILVVGRQGQLATDLVAAGERMGARLIALGRPELDITDPDVIPRALDAHAPAAIINAAAYTAVDRAESEPELALALNRDGPSRLAKACASREIALIHVSTDQVFDGRKRGSYVETDPPNPLCVYGRSKLLGEEAVATESPEHLIVRVSWIFGPSGDNFVKKLLAWARERETLAIVSDQRGRPTYGPGLAEALLRLACAMTAGEGARPHGLVHLAGASVMARHEQALAVMAGSAARGGPVAAIRPVPTSDFPTPATRPLNAELDPTLAAERHGLRLAPFEVDLATTLDAIIGPVMG